MTCLQIPAAERAQLAMMLEVCAYPKPGNVDRCHDYPDTRLEHFLASTIFARSAFEEAEPVPGGSGRSSNMQSVIQTAIWEEIPTLGHLSFSSRLFTGRIFPVRRKP